MLTFVVLLFVSPDNVDEANDESRGDDRTGTGCGERDVLARSLVQELKGEEDNQTKIYRMNRGESTASAHIVEPANYPPSLRFYNCVLL